MNLTSEAGYLQKLVNSENKGLEQKCVEGP